jgi:SAM-dependent methyltransferase
MSVHNPGTFTPRRIKGPREIVGITARQALAGHPVNAGALGIAESANWLIAHAGKALRPRVRCSCCGHEGVSFLAVFNSAGTAWNAACPRCDSRSRHRGLSMLIPKLIAAWGGKPRTLHMAPEEVLRRVVEPLTAVYHTSDLKMDGVTYPNEDLMHSRLPASSYDLVLCNHVLEHVEDDVPAVAAIARTLKPGGFAVVTVPGNFSRPETVRFPDNSLGGHWRDYGLDIGDLFRTSFDEVETIDMSAFDRAAGGLSHAIHPGEPAFVLRKPQTRSH